MEASRKGFFLYHFTKEQYAKSIEVSNKLRLYNILKRYEEGEIKDFIKDFKIPFENHEHYQDIFYSSFTTKIPSLSDKKTMKEFRNFTGKYGARLKFRVLREDSHIKYIEYDKLKFKVIHDLTKKIKDEHNISLIINGFSTIFASFYVNQKYSYENEVRLVQNLLFDDGFQIKNDCQGLPYIDFKLGNNILKLEEVIYERDDEIFLD